jgi:AraC family transcriptional regulator
MNKQIELQQPRLETRGTLLIAGLSEHYTSETAQNIPALWQRFVPHIGNVPGQIGRKAYGVCSKKSSDTDGFDYLSGVEVADFSSISDELSRISIPAQRYLVFPHLEHVSRLGDTVGAIFYQWLPASEHEAAHEPDFFELYGEKFDPQTGRGDIEVWVPIKS